MYGMNVWQTSEPGGVFYYTSKVFRKSVFLCFFQETKKRYDFVGSISLSDENTEISLSEKSNTLTVWQHCNGITNKMFTMKTEIIATVEDWSYDLKLILNKRFVLS